MDYQAIITAPFGKLGIRCSDTDLLGIEFLPGKTKAQPPKIGSSAQAVGQACGSNPIPIVIPCHRVVGKGSLGGFMKHAAGESLDIKRWLLDHERR